MPLLKNVVEDLRAAQESKGLCSLYFTKESHIHTLLNLVLASELNIVMPKIPPLDYFASITFEVYERGSGTEDQQHALLISVSEGAHSSNILSISLDARHALTPLPRRPLTTHMDLDEAIGKLSAHSSRENYANARLDRGQVEGATVFFGVDDPDEQLMPIKQRRESIDTDRSSIKHG